MVVADVLMEAREMLRARLEEVDAEQRELQQAVSSLDPVRGRARRSGRPKGRGTGAGKAPQRGKPKRAAKGQRLEEVGAILKANPKAETGEIARRIGISPNQVSSLRSRLAVKAEPKGASAKKPAAAKKAAPAKKPTAGKKRAAGKKAARRKRVTPKK